MPVLSNEMAMAVNEFLVSLPFYKIMLTVWIVIALAAGLKCISLESQIESLQRQMRLSQQPESYPNPSKVVTEKRTLQR